MSSRGRFATDQDTINVTIMDQFATVMTSDRKHKTSAAQPEPSSSTEKTAGTEE